MGVVRDGQGRVSYYLVGDAQTQGHNFRNKYQPHELPKRILTGKVKFIN